MEFNNLYTDIVAGKAFNQEEDLQEGLLGRLASGTALGLSLATGTPDAEAKSNPSISQTANQPSIDQKIQAFNNIFTKQQDKLINALIQVESKGKDNAVGDHGDAVGPLQIHQEVVSDYNRWMKTNLKHENMFDRKTAIEVCKKYLSVYGREYIKKTGELPSVETLAKIWNGGPNGWKNPKTEAYSAKVLAYL